MYCLAYVIFIMLDTAPEMGGRKIMAFRKLGLWKWFSDYFPIRLMKTVDLDPKKNYLFGYHPHGKEMDIIVVVETTGGRRGPKDSSLSLSL
jgi:hypothetical protein